MTAGLVQHEMQTATTTLIIALVLLDGGQNDSAMIEPIKAAARNSDLMKSMLSLIGSPTILPPYTAQHGQAVFIERPWHAYQAIKMRYQFGAAFIASGYMIANYWQR